jgi:hypothetical protein
VGVPIKEENTAYDQITMTFLGIELDTIAIDNVLKIKNTWLPKSKFASTTFFCR